MDPAGLRAWFDRYLEAFAACGRGASDDLPALLDFYGLPLVVTTDEAASVLTGADDVMDVLGRQVAAMRAAGYDDTETIGLAVTPLNASSALLRADVARRRADGTELERLGVTYLVIDGPAGPRIFALAVHSG